MLGTRFAVGQAEDVRCLDGAGIVPDVGRHRAVRQHADRHAYDIADEVQCARLRGEIGAHVDLVLASPHQVVMGQVAARDRDLDMVGIDLRGADADCGDICVQAAEARIDLAAFLRILILDAVVQHRRDVADPLVAAVVVRAAHLEYEAGAGVDRVEVGVGDKSEGTADRRQLPRRGGRSEAVGTLPPAARGKQGQRCKACPKQFVFHDHHGPSDKE